MANLDSSGPSAITLEQLIALNDEIAALVRAGVPLESGLGHLGADLPGRLGRITSTLAERMQRGESLPEILRRDTRSFPPVYRAVVEAGIRTGRLAAALESVAGSARRLAETRRLVLSAMLYPLLVFLVAWCLFLVLVAQIAPRMAVSHAAFSSPAAVPMRLLADWGQSVVYWGPAVPAIVVALAALGWFWSGRGALVESAKADLLFGWLPWVGTMLRSLRIAAFAELLAMLVDNDVPLSEGLALAAQATGDRRTCRAMARMTEVVRQGRTLDQYRAGKRDFPPLLVWLMVIGQQRSGLVPALRHAAEIYHRRAHRQAEAARVFLPVLLTAAIGGSVTLAYALVVFLPWVALLRALS